MSKQGMITAEHWQNVLGREFEKESDRAAVIIASSMLETALENILRTRLVPTDSSQDSLLDGAYAPIASFSARIDLAYRIGLISTRFARDLHIIRRLRNDFAHNIEGCSFNDLSVRNRMLELIRSSQIIENDPEMRKGFPKGIRGDFQMITSWMLWRLCRGAETTCSIEPHTLEFGYWDKERYDKVDTD